MQWQFPRPRQVLHVIITYICPSFGHVENMLSFEYLFICDLDTFPLGS
jgi:hypothetical protein